MSLNTPRLQEPSPLRKDALPIFQLFQNSVNSASSYTSFRSSHIHSFIIAFFLITRLASWFVGYRSSQARVLRISKIMNNPKNAGYTVSLTSAKAQLVLGNKDRSLWKSTSDLPSSRFSRFTASCGRTSLIAFSSEVATRSTTRWNSERAPRGYSFNE